MALNTSNLNLTVQERLANGESPQKIVDSWPTTTSVAAIKQYTRKFNIKGQQVAQNYDIINLREIKIDAAIQDAIKQNIDPKDIDIISIEADIAVELGL